MFGCGCPILRAFREGWDKQDVQGRVLGAEQWYPTLRKKARRMGHPNIGSFETVLSQRFSHNDAVACDIDSLMNKLLPMTFTMPRTLKLAAAATLLSLVAAPVYAQDWAKARLEASPRHHEYVPLKHGDRTVQAFVVYPEVKSKAPVIVLIREIFGLSDWAKEMADELAAQGYIVIAPDLLTGFGPNGGGSDAFTSRDETT